MSTSRLTDLAKAILEAAGKVEDYLDTNHLAQPSFDEHGPTDFRLSPEIQQAQQKAIESAMELQDLLLGPANLLRPTLNGASLQAIHVYDIPSRVPLDGKISFADLAKQTGLRDLDVQRILRFAMVHHRIFREKEAGFVSHTAASRMLAEDPMAMAGLGFMFDECYQSFAHTVESLRTSEDPKPHQSGWAIARKSDMPMWDYFTAHPELGQRAGLAMASFSKGFGHDLAALCDAYDWKSLDESKGVVVDLGGADGKVAVELARRNPGISFIVQDIPAVTARFKDSIPRAISDRVTLAPHDFLQVQPTTADVYLFRQIFHNWSDTQSLQILRALIPALKPGAKVLVNDTIVPPPGTLPLMPERGVRSIDMIMLSLFNAREREKEHWEALFAEADTRYQHVKVWQPAGSQLGLIEATWSG